MSKVTIITYHYVRDLKNSRYPNLKGLDLDIFKKQLDYIAKNHTVIRMYDLITSVLTGNTIVPHIPENSALLVFDDAYLDHYTNVFPLLKERGMQGSFFVPVLPMITKKVMDVNKLHFILASQSVNKSLSVHLTGDIVRCIEKYREEFVLEDPQFYLDRYMEENRFDDPNTMFVKRMLQKVLPTQLRTIILEELFREYVDVDEAVLHNELYMNRDQVKHMLEAGMYIGGHTYNHYHLGSLSETEQEMEISASKTFLQELGVNSDYLTMSYPYGSHNDVTKKLLKDFGFKLGIGIEFGIFDISQAFDPFNVPRIDCNDITQKLNIKTD